MKFFFFNVELQMKSRDEINLILNSEFITIFVVWYVVM